ncbi:MAG: hypothetical protein KF819_13290 [Labilithrix sp.]|nr:hypothetical protein [Labilithrix sp.]
MNKTLALIPACLLLVAAGCKREDTGEPRSATTTTGAPGMGTLANEEGMGRIIEARCDREVACDNVGEGKKYVTRERCRKDIRAATVAELGPNPCPNGLREERINACISEVRGEKCSVSGDDLAKVAVCRHAAICVPK